MYTWYVFITGGAYPTIKHEVALGVILINLPLYFFRYRIALFFTAAILLLATFNLLAFFPTITTSSFGLGPISTPELQWSSLLLLIVFYVVNLPAWRRKRGAAQGSDR